MQYYSTNKQSPAVTFTEAILQSQPPDRGLYMPERIPRITHADLEQWRTLSYAELAAVLSTRWIGDEIDEKMLHELCTHAYTWPVPIWHTEGTPSVLELWHGPTAAFKDFAAQWSGGLMRSYLTPKERLLVLVATSGDTGGAVASGYFNIPNLEVVILYPSGQVSPLQEKQLTTLGGNVHAIEVQGSFDECQHLVKEAFADKELTQQLHITSANSINIARLIPQSFYYVWAYLHTVRHIGEPVIFCVPSGNFGNLTAGLFAQHMGLPVSLFIAAENTNQPVFDYLTRGVYTPRPSVPTFSNAMDIGAPSNIARIFDLYAKNKKEPARYDNVAMEELQKILWCTSVDDKVTLETIKTVHHNHNYIIDPHTAVGWEAIRRWQRAHPGDAKKIILLSTAHPAKFMNIIERVVPKKAIAIPRTLAEVLQKQKQATKMLAQYDALKKILLSSPMVQRN